MGPILFLYFKNAKVGPVLREVVASHPEEVAAAEEVRTFFLLHILSFFRGGQNLIYIVYVL